MKTEQPQTVVKVTLGKISNEYKLFRTIAPQRYDGFGTLTLYTGEEGVRLPFRLVLIKTQNIDWQLMRYGSALFSCVVSDEFSEDECCDRLFEAMIKPFIEEGVS